MLTTSNSPLRAVYAKAAEQLLSLAEKPLTLRLVPNAGDVERTHFEMQKLWAVIDPVIAALGNYAADHFGISEKVVQEHFHHVLEKAMDGNSTYVIEAAYNDAVEDRMSYQRDTERFPAE